MIHAGMTPVILDNLYNSKSTVLGRIEKVAGIKPKFVEGDIRNKALMVELLTEHKIDAVIHFAGLKSRWRIGSEATGILW